MKRFVRFLLIVLLVVLIIAVGCNTDYLKLKWAAYRYQQVMEGEIPEDLTLTVYYIPHYILTRAPLTVEDLKDMTCSVKIVVESEELVKHLATLKQLNASVLQPTEEDYGINACFYYVFELGNQKILEVVFQQYDGQTDSDVGTFVNGIRVESNSVLYEIILPFLSEFDREELGILR